MIDLTNKTPEELNTLIQKYLSVLQEVKAKPEQYVQLAYIINIAVQYFAIHHMDLPNEWKTWCTLALKELCLKNKINSEIDITDIIEDFVNNYNLNFESYCSFMISASEYDQQRGFVHTYILKKGR
jgi:hypothetical protein